MKNNITKINANEIAGRITSFVKATYPNATLTGIYSTAEYCHVNFKVDNNNYCMSLVRDEYADKQETDNADQN